MKIVLFWDGITTSKKAVTLLTGKLQIRTFQRGNHMIRVIYGIKRQDHTNMKNIREKIKMMSVNQMAVYHTILECYNIMKNSASEQILTKWSNSSKQNYSLRSIAKNTIKVPEKPKAKCLGFSYFGPKLYNLLPKNIRETENPTSFKKMTKDWIWINIPSQ